MDRTRAPQIKEIEHFDYIKASFNQLKNGIPLYSIAQDDQEVIKLECVFKAGIANQSKPLVAKAVSELMKEGTATYTSEEIAAQIEQRGAMIDTSVKADALSITLYTLSDQLIHLLPTLQSILTEATFPEEELGDFLANSKQKFAVNCEKVSFLAKNEFMEQIFGTNHPYNDKLRLEDYDDLKQSDLQEYYANFIQNKSFALLVSGKMGADEKYIIDQHFGALNLTEAAVSSPNYSVNSSNEQRIKVQKKGATQAALRLGKQTIGKDHSDFPALFFLNTLLGGFFGSRLMTNIREEKGYTYGIGSGLVSLSQASYFFIASEIGANYVEETLEEIKKEINRLCEEKIANEELNLLKRYLQGSLMRNFDGSFAAMDRFKSLYLLNLDYTYYDRLWEVFNEMTAEKLQQTAKKYLNFEDLKIIVAGA